jgi:hypothetical protein
VDERQQLVAQPAHKLAIPLFLLTALLYMGTVAFEYFTNCCHAFDETFAWFGGFYITLGVIFLVIKNLKSQE